MLLVKSRLHSYSDRTARVFDKFCNELTGAGFRKSFHFQGLPIKDHLTQYIEVG